MSDHEAELRHIRAVAIGLRAAVLDRYSKSTCILTTAALIDALAADGIPATPLAVGVFLMNGTFYERALAERRFPEGGAELNGWIAGGAWSVGVGYGAENPAKAVGRWDGHLVALVRGRYLVDASLDQCDRPQHGIAAGLVVEALGTPVLTTPAVNGMRVQVGLQQGMAVYELRPGDRSYERAPDWRDMNRRLAVIAAARLRERRRQAQEGRR